MCVRARVCRCLRACVCESACSSMYFSNQSFNKNSRGGHLQQVDYVIGNQADKQYNPCVLSLGEVESNGTIPQSDGRNLESCVQTLGIDRHFCLVIPTLQIRLKAELAKLLAGIKCLCLKSEPRNMRQP